jgi:hypothetical protein
VYAETAASGEPFALRPARERGFEGVACVDDAARAIVLYCTLWSRFREPSTKAAALSLLAFLAYMQDADGRFTNFLLDWTGEQNRTGITSIPGGPQWQARALHALACAAATFGGGEWDQRFRRGLRWVDDVAYLDVRAVCVLAALRHWEATGERASAARSISWAAEIAAHHGDDDRLLDAAGVTDGHLWGHLQEAALANCGRALDRPDLVERARLSADALLVPAAEQCATLLHLLPFDVSCVVAGLEAVAVATGDRQYRLASARARQWFLGRNSAARPVYDDVEGRVFDGIDEGRVSRNSGAESNIEGALALLRPSAVVNPGTYTVPARSCLEADTGQPGRPRTATL